MINIRKEIKKLSITDKYYKQKIKILAQLVEEPNVGHIIDGKISTWCEKIGLYPEFNQQDGCDWWTCSAKKW